MKGNIVHKTCGKSYTLCIEVDRLINERLRLIEKGLSIAENQKAIDNLLLAIRSDPNSMDYAHWLTFGINDCGSYQDQLDEKLRQTHRRLIARSKLKLAAE